ncbi:50S ribosomal protein L3 [bioreactor metagenome]|uniref:50S ribosomal protein L3 n=1 Tax=bioreactor metagenome TaxID=1076179 RepID=A0A644W0Z6_9ZZZZ|nr:50S ribosomal protein L3 [Acidaminococcaceae bacterium]NLU44666.1 50S ribosomal protein L3 [Acholeplasmataceae bacterium]
MAKGILGKKLGMTQIFEADGKMIPVTVVEAGPCIVIQNKTEETDGYNAVQLGFGDLKEKHTNQPMKGHFDKAGVTPVKFVRELRLSAPSEYTVGQKLAADIFAAGEMIDATGVSRGKGFAGTIKRHNFACGPMAHGSKSHREPGSNGPMHSGPGGRVIKGKKLPGRMGGANVTVQRLTVAKVDLDRNLILVSGSIPGAAGSFVILKETVKPDIVKATKK